MPLVMDPARCLEIPYRDYVDRILGGWIGKSIGGTIGGPVECHKLEMDYTPETCWPREKLPNDDLDIQVVWLEALKERGPFIDSDVLAQYWQDRCWYNFCEYGAFLYNWQRGIAPPWSGRFNNRFFRTSMGCPIRSEIWGLVCAGNPELAAEYARMDGELDHADESVHAEEVLAAAAAHAFFCDDMGECLRTGVAQIPAGSILAATYRAVESLCAETEDWRKVRRAIVRRWGHRDSSRALVNQALTYMALLLGQGDFVTTAMIALNSGWDTDCTMASALALLGIARGVSCIPEEWKAQLGDRLNCALAVENRNALLSDFAEQTAQIGVEMTQTRNHRVRILDAPETPVRYDAPPRITLDAAYLAAPVLWDDAATPIRFTVTNNTRQTLGGRLLLRLPGAVAAPLSEVELTLRAGASHQMDVLFHKASLPGAPIPDKNLIRIVWEEADYGCERVVGLAGSRPWTVYGPYWDIYDTSRHAECPFRNNTTVMNPARAGCLYAAYHQYVRLDRPYLDEDRLLSRPLPEEDPVQVEVGEDVVTHEDLGGFVGEACYYLTRTLHAPCDMSVYFQVGATGSFAGWLNGEEVGRHDGVQPWAPSDFACAAALREGPNRLVVKCLRQTDDFAFSLQIIRTDLPKDKKKGIAPNEDRLASSFG
jgi:ADP-ribosylglycohydrolase